MRRRLTLTAAVLLGTGLVCLPSGAGAVDEERGSSPASVVTAPHPDRVPAAPAIEVIEVAPTVPQAPALAALASPPLPATGPAPALITEILAPAPVPNHMAELCSARAVFCQVDSSGRYLGS